MESPLRNDATKRYDEEELREMANIAEGDNDKKIGLAIDIVAMVIIVTGIVLCCIFTLVCGV